MLIIFCISHLIGKPVISGICSIYYSPDSFNLFSPAEKSLPFLFKRYMQASTDHARKYGGTGLGLSICKQLVRFFQFQILIHLKNIIKILVVHGLNTST
jgi:hypothetical protein